MWSTSIVSTLTQRIDTSVYYNGNRKIIKSTSQIYHTKSVFDLKEKSWVIAGKISTFCDKIRLSKCLIYNINARRLISEVYQMP